MHAASECAVSPAERNIPLPVSPNLLQDAVQSRGEDGAMTSVPLTVRSDFFGTVMLAPKRRPARILGPMTDDELLRLAKEYFR